MQKCRQAAICSALCLTLIYFLADAQSIRAAAQEALALCGRSVIPALFPFMTISTLLISLGFGRWLSPYLAGLMTPLFRLPGQSGSALLLGLIGGYPIGAKTAAELYREDLLTQPEAEYLLTFCNNSNPVFLISVIGIGIFGSVRVGIWLWLIHITAALLVGVLLRNQQKSVSRQQVTRNIPFQCPSFSSAFVAAVRGSAATMMSVCAFVILFYVAAEPLRTIGGAFSPLLVGALELFSLTPLLEPTVSGFILAAACSGWGGLSVLCQTAAILDGTGLSLRPCFVGKCLHGILSAVLAAALCGYILG